MLHLGALPFYVISQGFRLNSFLFADDTNILGPRVKGTGIRSNTRI